MVESAPKNGQSPVKPSLGDYREKLMKTELDTKQDSCIIAAESSGAAA